MVSDARSCSVTRTAPEVCRDMERFARNAESIQGRYAAYFQLHVAACLDKDKERIQEYRQALHVLLDQLLDNQEAIQRTSDELAQLARGG